jgi:hypothetical protein
MILFLCVARPFSNIGTTAIAIILEFSGFFYFILQSGHIAYPEVVYMKKPFAVL